MGFNFPNSPVLNDTYVYGGQSYTWSGYAWMLTEGGIAPPADYVDVTGDVMTGPLVLSGAPIYGDEAVTKNYVDSMALASGSGNVIGPAAAIADNIVMFDGVTGKLIKDSGIPIGNLVHAAPLDAMAYNGMQINGSMEVCEEFGSWGGVNFPNATKYIVDGWKAGSQGVQVVTGQQTGNAPPGFNTALQIYVNGTPNAAPADSDYCFIGHRAEGHRVARLGWGTANAQPVTIGFWFMATRTGMFSASVSNKLYNRSYPFSFNVSAAQTWEYHTVTIPGDTTGTWEKTNLEGLVLQFAVMAGNATCAAAGAWYAGGYLGVPGTVNCCAAINDWVCLTGVVILPGIEAPSAARSALIMRPYDQELLVCQRYWESGTANGPTNTDGLFSAGAVATQPTTFRVRKLGVPVMTYSDSHPGGNAGRFCGNLMLIGPAYNQVVTGGDIVGTPTVDGFVSDFSATACGTNRWSCFWTANSRL